MKWEQIHELLKAGDEDGWCALWWPRTAGAVTRFGAREERRGRDRIRVRLHPDDQGEVGCELLEFVR